ITNHRIKDLVPKGLLNAETSTLLVNALYFKGIWYDEFDVEKTTKKNFYSSPDHTVEIDMMHMNENEMYYENDQVQLLSLKYEHCSAKMIIILPKEKFGLKKVMDQLNGSTLRRWISELDKKEVHMQIPKFKIEQSFNLNESLRKLGLSLPFTDDADFSAMVEGTKIKISDVVHKAFIEVDEKGTEAAAASFAKMVPCSLFISNEGPKIFTADHPFLFILKAGRYEQDQDTILFMGKFYGRHH
uniref:Serpin domain-containing protein n=1 Tax=Romanomermis culicivorax TaxID=13658 RepID=A0A915HZ33_ROMCU